MMKKNVCFLLLGLAAATVAEAATTWNVSLTTADKYGLTGVTSLTNALTKAASGDTIVIAPGVYDLSVLTPFTVPDWGYTYLTAFKPDGTTANQHQLTLVGGNNKHWSEKTPEEETILRGNNEASIFFCHGSTGRRSSFLHLTFENGKRVNRSGTGSYGGGAISMAQTEQINLKNMCQIVSNCVFRNCSSEYSGGATRGPDVYDSLYSNCTSTVSGGAAYGFMGNNGTTCPYNTNQFVRCVFKDCSAPVAGAIYGVAMDRLQGCTFVNCRATSGVAGAVQTVTPVSTIADCVFTNCTSLKGGALYCNLDVGEIARCTFASGAASSNGGGALWCDRKIGRLSDCAFTGNTGYGEGGAIRCFGIGTLDTCVFEENQSGNGSSGGAICCRDVAIDVVTNCTFVRNAGAYAGGGLYSNNTIGKLADCVFRDNSAVNCGGGLWALSSIGTLTNCTFIGNSCKDKGGAVGSGGAIGAAVDCRFVSNVAVTDQGGVYSTNFGTVFTNCLFCANTNSVTGYGAHANNAARMVRCTFSGYGDVAARHYEACVFSNCVYRYTEPAYGSDAHGLITYPHALGDGTIRNCLVRDCHVSRILTTEGVRTDVANCTFVNNIIEDDRVKQDGNGHGIMFFAYRGGSPYVASTNVMVNCIFADNHVRNNSHVTFDPCDAFFQGSSSQVFGHTIVSNCLYKNVKNTDSSEGAYCFFAGTWSSQNLNRGDPKFAKDSSAYASAPAYMPRRGSAARGWGLWLDWMTGARDLNGAEMPLAAPDLGCYQCTLLPLGCTLLIK